MSGAAQARIRRKITTPEELHDYIHVTGPSLWILLTMIILLLVAMIILASILTMENTMDVKVEVSYVDAEEPPVLVSTLQDDRKSLVKIGMKVRVAGEEGTVRTIVEDQEEVVVMIEPDRPDTKLKEGSYDAEILLESASPISYLLKP